MKTIKIIFKISLTLFFGGGIILLITAIIFALAYGGDAVVPLYSFIASLFFITIPLLVIISGIIAYYKDIISNIKELLNWIKS
ncbi:MAG: hypothetical protein M0P71_13180 [Melioribacteraceae bacterium]|jgi:hypothetical protein|nr:hypothetical protein [Melioribacteraceae bacterium]